MTPTGRSCPLKSSVVSVLGTKIETSDQAFLVAGPRAWNSLSATVPETKALLAF